MFRVLEYFVDRTGVNWKAFKHFVCSRLLALNIAPRPEAESTIVARPPIDSSLALVGIR